MVELSLLAECGLVVKGVVSRQLSVGYGIPKFSITNFEIMIFDDRRPDCGSGCIVYIEEGFSCIKIIPPVMAADGFGIAAS